MANTRLTTTIKVVEDIISVMDMENNNFVDFEQLSVSKEEIRTASEYVAEIAPSLGEHELFVEYAESELYMLSTGGESSEYDWDELLEILKG